MFSYISDSIRRIAVFIGILAFLVVGLALSLFDVYRAWIWAMVIAASVALLIASALPFLIWKGQRRYRQAEKRVGAPILFKSMIRVRTKHLDRIGNLYVADGRLCIYLWENEPYLETVIMREQVSSAVLQQDGTFLLTLSGREDVSFILPGDVSPLLHVMQEQGYPVHEE